MWSVKFYISGKFQKLRAIKCQISVTPMGICLISKYTIKYCVKM